MRLFWEQCVLDRSSLDQVWTCSWVMLLLLLVVGSDLWRVGRVGACRCSQAESRVSGCFLCTWYLLLILQIPSPPLPHTLPPSPHQPVAWSSWRMASNGSQPSLVPVVICDCPSTGLWFDWDQDDVLSLLTALPPPPHPPDKWLF